MICSMNLPGTEIRLTGLFFPESFLLQALVIHGCQVWQLPVTGTSLVDQHFWEIIEGEATNIVLIADVPSVHQIF